MQGFERSPNIAVGEAVIVNGKVFDRDYYNDDNRKTIIYSSIEVIKPQKQLNDFLKQNETKRSQKNN